MCFVSKSNNKVNKIQKCIINIIFYKSYEHLVYLSLTGTFFKIITKRVFCFYNDLFNVNFFDLGIRISVDI